MITIFNNYEVEDVGIYCVVGYKYDGSLLTAGNADWIGESQSTAESVWGDKWFNLDELSKWSGIVKIRADDDKVVGLKNDGTVLVAETGGKEQYDVTEWTNVVDIAVGTGYIIGLHRDGWIYAAGDDGEDEYGLKKLHIDLESICMLWDEIDKVYGCVGFAFGLHLQNGKVEIAGSSSDHEDHYRYGSDISTWTNIIQIFANYLFVIGLKANGNVVYSAWRNKELEYLKCVEDWTDIVDIKVTDDAIVGLKSDGTIVVTGKNGWFGQNDVSDWTDIVSIAVTPENIIGLTQNGTIVMTNAEPDELEALKWKDIVSINADCGFIVGVKKDGTVNAIGRNNKLYCGDCDINSWRLFENFDTLEEERKKAQQAAIEVIEKQRKEKEEQERLFKEQERIKKEQEQKELITQRDMLQQELNNLKGIFKGGKRKEIERQINQISSRIELLDK